MVFRKKYLAGVNDSAYDLPCPINLSFAWSFGSILGIFYTQQVVSGLLLSLHYSPATLSAFETLFYIQRDIANGWSLRNIHANGASFLMLFCYLHMARALFMGSASRTPLVWLSGLILLFLMMAAAFLGYVLPWGQMSFWGATVITNLFSVIPVCGTSLVEWLWGGFTVSGPTLNRFFVLHFIIPLIMAPLIMIHMLLLHSVGSSNPLGCPSVSVIPFHPYMSSMDVVSTWFWIGMFAIFVTGFPHTLGSPDNFEKADPMKTPIHIQPEWYFLPFYAMLRSVPHKTGGVVVMVLSLVVLFFMPLLRGGSPIRNFYQEMIFMVFCWNVVALGWIGACPLETPYLALGGMHSCLYFIYFSSAGWSKSDLYAIKAIGLMTQS